MQAKRLFFIVILLCTLPPKGDAADSPTILRFSLITTPHDLHRLAQPSTPFNKIGRQFALLGFESGTFEAWAYPLKLMSSVKFAFLLGESSRPIPAQDIVRYIDVSPSFTTLTFTFQSFVVKAHYITAIDEAAAMVLFEVESTTPLTILCSFSPVLQPMWPAGMGGQYAFWDDQLKAYVISEPTRKNHALIGSPAASGISYTPAHMLSDNPSEFKIDIPDPEQIRNRFVPIYIAGGKGRRDSLIARYTRLSRMPYEMYASTASHYRNLLESGVRIETPVSSLNLAYTWAKIVLDGLLVHNPDLGTGLVAGWGASGASGRPGFGWFFGGDAFINSLGLTSMGWHHVVCDALRFTQKWQREDGKIAHELSQAAGYIDWFGAYPYAYIHGDTTPFYIIACYEYVKASQDLSFLRESWRSLLKAYQWCLSTDQNGDGLMDNAKAGLGSVEYGALTNLATDIYTGSLSVHMSYAMSEMANWLNDARMRRKALDHHQTAQAAFDAKFWDEKARSYSNAFNDNNERLPDPSPWISTAALFSAGSPNHIETSMQRLARSDLSTDWGVRSISSNSKYYEPLNYNYGGVWPFLTGFVSTAHYLVFQNQQAYANLYANCQHTFINNLGAINELFSGRNYLWPQEAVSQQGFSSLGVVLPMLRGLFGLEGDALLAEVRMSPRFPPDWKMVRLEGFSLGNSRWSLDYQRTPGQIRAVIRAEGGEDYLVSLAPSLGLGALVDSVRVNGLPSPFICHPGSQAVRPEVKFRFPGEKAVVEFYYRPGLELIIPEKPLRLGDSTSGIKVVSMTIQENVISIVAEGIAGYRYHFSVPESQRIRAVHGAKRDADEIILELPVNDEFSYVSAEFEVELEP